MTYLFRWHRSSAFIWLACIALAACWDFLFYDQPIGWSIALFGIALLVPLTLRTPRLWKKWSGRFALLLMASLLLALVEQPSILSVLMAMLTFAAVVLIANCDLPLAGTVSAWLARFLRLAATVWTRFLFDNLLIARWLFRHPRSSGRFARSIAALAWWVLPLMAGTFFLLLFAVANPVITNWLRDFFNNLWTFLDWLIYLSPLRVILWIIVAILTYGILRHRRSRARRLVIVAHPYAQSPADIFTAPQMIIRLLIVLNLVFVIENALDIAYLFLGVPLPEGLAYREYAHRGAYTLIITALLAGILTLISFRHNGAAHRSAACRRLVYIWIAQNIFLLLSTVMRVCIYVDNDKLTRLRLSTMIWCGIVAAGFLWVILRIMQAKTNAWLWRMNAFTAFAVLFVCAFINFDGIIANFNVHHCAQTGGRGAPLDIEYLQHLGTPSFPALTWLHQHPGTLSPTEKSWTDTIITNQRAELTADLSNWRSWTFRRWREANTSPVLPEVASR